MTALLGSMKAEVVGAAVDTRVFQELPKNERAFWTGQLSHRETGKTYGTGAPSRPFIVAFAAAVSLALEFGEGSPALSVLLDHDDTNAAQAFNLCYQANAIPKQRGRVRGFLSGSRKKFNALQLADLAAWLWNRYLTRDDLTEEQLFAMDRLTKKGSSVRLLNAEAFDILRAQQPELAAVLAAQANANGSQVSSGK